MQIKQKIKDFNLKVFIKTPLGRHIYSFVKTYFTVFLALYLYGIDGQEEIMLSDMTIIVPAVKWSFVATLRSVYKWLTEE